MEGKKKKKTLLLNPPGIKRYFRDYYCSKISKADYYYHPIDLVYLSGPLNKISEVYLIDAIADNISIVECLSKAVEIKADYIIFMCSAPSVSEDFKFIQNLKSLLPNSQFIGTGDILKEQSQAILQEYSFIDAVLNDFSHNDIIKYLTKEKGQPIINITYRFNDTIIEENKQIDVPVFDVPIPLWNLFIPVKYRFPFSKHKLFASILTDYGCPYHCDFCPIGNIGFRLRPVDNLIQELKLLQDLNIKELYIRDQTFGVNKKRSIELLNKIINENFNFSWTCLTRLDVINDELLSLIKKAGCHTVMLGIESADPVLLNKYNKNTGNSNTTKIISLIKKYNIRIGGFFMFGFPEEDIASVNRTIDMACSLNLDFVSFNIVTPRHGTYLRNDAISKGILRQNMVSESSESAPEWEKSKISPKDLIALKKQAVRKFYLRPSYISHQILKKRSFWELKNIIHQFLKLLKKNT